MSVNITFDGQPYIVPETGEVGWGGNTTSYLVAIAAGCLQKTGGSFTLSAETDFGADFGIQSLYYKSRTADVASAGILRLANNSDNIAWRNAANNADLSLLVNASDQLTYETDPILTGTGPSAYVASATGTANQVIASASTGAVTFSLPQNIDTGAAVQFGALGLGSAVVASSILSLTSTTLGFLPPRMDTTARDNISTPATGLLIYNTSTGTNDYFNGSVWVALAAGGTINAGIQFQLGYYAVNGSTLSGLTLITASRALVSDANGLPIAATTTTAELQALAGLTASRALQTDGSGLVSPSAVTSTELGFVSGVTSAIQTQLDNLIGLRAYRRPILQWTSVTQVAVEANTGTTNETKIVFSDGESRAVVNVTTTNRLFDITLTAEYTSGTESTGLYTALSEATDTWYAIYAVKSLINSANFVLVGDTTLPLQANFSTLNSRYGTDGWIYIGLIRNGDASVATGDILDFIQSSNLTLFKNAVPAFQSSPGIFLATTAGATTLTYTRTSGTGTTDIPNNISQVIMGGFIAAGTTQSFFASSTGAHNYLFFGGTTLRFNRLTLAADEGLRLSNGSSIVLQIGLVGFYDTVLGVGSNPVL